MDVAIFEGKSIATFHEVDHQVELSAGITHSLPGLLPGQGGLVPSPAALQASTTVSVSIPRRLLPGQEGLVPGPAVPQASTAVPVSVPRGLLPSRGGLVPGSAVLQASTTVSAAIPRELSPGQGGLVPSCAVPQASTTVPVSRPRGLLPGRGGLVRRSAQKKGAWPAATPRMGVMRTGRATDSTTGPRVPAGRAFSPSCRPVRPGGPAVRCGRAGHQTPPASPPGCRSAA